MSVSSMTGFAHIQKETILGALSLDLKSVNSRYQEVAIRLPEELRFLEGEIRARLVKAVKRGKIECRLTWMGDTAIVEQSLDQTALVNVLSLQEAVLKFKPDARPLTVSNILQFPGLLKPQSIDEDALTGQVMEALSEAIDVFAASRIREGEALAVVINGYCDRIVETVKELEPKLPLILENLQTKLEERLKEALTKTLTDHATLTAEEINDRIRQEVILYAIKMDVDEEMNRLLTHVKEIRRLLSTGGEVGKKLDFMMQELNREANTLGSKAAAIEMTQTSLALKVNIEKMREQVQNLE